jgi:ferredoxin
VNTNKTTLVCFSPTGTTRRILEEIGRGINTTALEELDLTLPVEDAPERVAGRDELVVIGVPVYFGRVAPLAAQRLRRLKADGAPAVTVVVYGNRDFEDALLELSDLAKQAGFVPVGAAAFIGEHSYSTAATPVAVGRPDSEDLAQARAFGEAVRKKIEKTRDPETLPSLRLPGKMPYREIPSFPDMSPEIIEEFCNLCGQCAAVCPTAAITIDTTVVTDKTRCITCCACVKACPIEARVIKEPQLIQVAEWLSSTLQERKSPVTFV